MGRQPATVPWRLVGCGVVLSVHLTPRSSRDGVDGISTTATGMAVKMRVRAIPEAGKANTALETLIADWLSIGRRSVAVTGGTSSRSKAVTITGVPERLDHDLHAKLAIARLTRD
jgi:uncharacterized protein